MASCRTPNLPVALRLCCVLGLDIDLDTVTYFVGMDGLVPTKKRSLLKGLQFPIFAFFWRNTTRVSESYNLSPDRTVAIGRRSRCDT